jgi:hypothetical protein
MAQRCIIWEPVAGITSPCADVSYRYEAPHRLTVRMNFSRTKGGPERDLELIFPGPIALAWGPEHFGSLDPIRGELPKCPEPRWAKWPFPLLKVVDSEWLKSYVDHHPGAEGRGHFYLVGMNDLVNVLALPDVEAQWKQP